MKLACVLLLAALAISCGYGSNYNQNMGPSGTITIQQLSPSSASAGGQGFVLTVNGTGFGTSAVVYWNGSQRNSSYVTANQLTAMISASDIAQAGTAQVYVGSNGMNSNTVKFIIN